MEADYTPGLDSLISDLRATPLSADAANAALLSILARLREVDADITPSLYAGPYTPGCDANDRPPEGDDYNWLFDAIVDEVSAPLNVAMKAAGKPLS